MLIWPTGQYNMSLYQIWSYLDQWSQIALVKFFWEKLLIQIFDDIISNQEYALLSLIATKL